MPDLTNKIVLITGAGSGMGRAMAQEYVRLGAKVAALGRSQDKLEKTLELCKGPGELFIVRADIASEVDVQTSVAAVIEHWGGIDILINNAGVLDSYAPAHEVTLDEWQSIININLTGPFLLCRNVIPHMLRKGKGIIINVASVASFSAAGGGSAYTASKHGLQGLTKQLCFEYGSKGIRVNEICPGATATPMAIPDTTTANSPDMEAAVQKVPAQRWCQPSEIAKLVTFLTSDDADYIHGSSYVIDGGWLTGAREAF